MTFYNLKFRISVSLIFLSATLCAQNIRPQKDTIGFASKAWQTDSILQRINTNFKQHFKDIYYNQNILKNDHFRLAICPHDDYAYAGFLYTEIFSHIKANTIIIFGVAHKAKKYGIEQKLVFDNFDYWHAPYGNIKISELRQQIIHALPKEDYIVHDSLQLEEHSVEAFLPFLQYYNKEAEIIPILVPYMSFTELSRFSQDMGIALNQVVHDNHLKWGKDIAILISSDAVHYGDEEWNNKNHAPYGCDTAGYKAAIDHEYKIMNDCFMKVNPVRTKKFYDYTVQQSDWHEYKWTWCGRYSIPFGLLTAYYFQQLSGTPELITNLSDYSTSIEHQPLKVDDLKLGTTAPASLHHWVGYSVSGYK